MLDTVLLGQDFILKGIQYIEVPKSHHTFSSVNLKQEVVVNQI